MKQRARWDLAFIHSLERAMSKKKRISLRLLSGHLPSQMFNWITPKTPPPGSSDSQRRHINKHKEINISVWIDFSAKTLVDTWGDIQTCGASDCAVMLAVYGSMKTSDGLHLDCFSRNCSDTHSRQQQTIKLWHNFCFRVKARANMTMRGMFDVTTETHLCPITTRPSVWPGKKKESDMMNGVGNEGTVISTYVLLYRFYMQSTCGHVCLPPVITTWISHWATGTNIFFHSESLKKNKTLRLSSNPFNIGLIITHINSAVSMGQFTLITSGLKRDVPANAPPLCQPLSCIRG